MTTPCPHCGHREEDAPPRPESTRDLARVNSAAEAGYLINVLEGVGLRAVVRPVESFDAVTGAWTTSYFVAVDERDAEDAARVLRAEAEEGFAEAFSGKFGGADPPAGAESGANPWRVLTVLAVVAATGAAATWGRAGREEKAPRVRVEPAGRLLEALAADPTPLQAEAADGGPRRRLWLNRDLGLWELSVDADRDGRYETTRRFAGPGVGR